MSARLEGRRGVRLPDSLHDREVRAERLFLVLCAQYGIPTHGPDAWALVIDTMPKQRLGQCRQRLREVGLTARYCHTAPWESVEDTIRHELAHVLAGVEAGHGPRWKAWARKLGARPKRAGKRADECGERPTPKWTGTCQDCGFAFQRHRLDRGIRANGRHRRCAEARPADPSAGQLVWRRHR